MNPIRTIARMRACRRAGAVAAALLALGAAPAGAADASACYGAYYTHVDVMQVAANHVVISAAAHGTGYVTRDDKSPMKGAYGSCVLFNEVIDGKPNGELRCVRTDAQGDTFLIVGKVKAYSPSGAMTGSYTITGLTGKWVGAKGGGNFSEDAGSGKDNKHYFVCFDGSYDMKK